MAANTRIKVSIPSDRMTALAEISKGPACGIAELKAALRAAGVIFMVDTAALGALAMKLSDANFACGPVIVARGRAPTAGVDGHFEPAFAMGIQPGHVDETGAMDFFDRELLKPITAGDYIGQLHQPIGGSPGKRVDGSEIKVASVRPTTLQTGNGISVAADGRMYAALSGVLVYSQAKIDITQQHVHNGDVDLHSGTLHMEGSISVRGNVQRQFAVRASGNVDIQGHVESGTVLAGGGIRISGRVRSGDAGVICAEGDVSVHHCEAAHVRCGGLLKLGSAINSDLQAGKIQVLGSVRGGTAQAETSVVVVEAGSERSGTTTILAAAVPMLRPLSDVKSVIESSKHRRTLQHAATRDSDERGKGGKAGRAAAALNEKELSRKAELAARRAELLASASVQVLGAAHPGVTVQLGLHSLQLEERVAGVRYVFDAGLRQIRKEKHV